LWRKADLIWSDAQGTLKQPLGSWLHASRDQRQRHFAYQFGSRLALRMNTEYHIYHRPQRQPYKFTGTVVPCEDLPHDAHATDPFSVCDTLAHGIRAVSDGSVRYNTQGSFGWVLSSGPARAPSPTSFCAEGYALLSLVLFLHRVKDFAFMHDPWIGIIGTDSKSLLHALLGKEKTPNPHRMDNPLGIEGEAVVLNVLRPDWDVLIKIQHPMKRLPEVMLQFTRGHQDRHTRFARLPLLAQL
jgi:hypothetical protein